MNLFRTSPKTKGFTLVEMMISISIFVLVAVVAIGALLKIMDANKKSQSLKTSINNLNYVLEAMTRELRVGSHYSCLPGSSVTTVSDGLPGDGCSIGWTWSIAFNSSKTCPSDSTRNLIYAYYFNGTSLQKAEQADCDQALNWYPLIVTDTAAESTITFTRGTVKVVNRTGVQSYVQFHFEGYSGAKEKNKTYFNLQTTVAQRLID